MSTHTHTSTLARSLKILSLAAAFSLYAATLQAAWIPLVGHDFDGLATEDLHGRAVDTFNITTGGSVTGNWVTHSQFTADGAFNGGPLNPSSHRSGHINFGNHIDNAKGTQDGLFRLTATIAPTVNWLTIGFSTLEAPSVNEHYQATGTGEGFATLLYNANGGITSYLIRAGDPVTHTAATALSAQTFTVEVDYRDWDDTSNWGTITWFQGETELRTVALGEFSGVALPQSIFLTGSGAGGDGMYSNLSLEQIPEPASGLLVLLGVGFWGFARWRQRK